MKHIAKLLLTGCIAVLISCLSPYEGETELPDEGLVEETNDLFNPYEGDPENVVRFYTNDTRYRSALGYTLWTHKAVVNDVEPAITVWKTMGSNAAGYGMVLYSKTRTVDGLGKQVFLTVLINNNGEYTVGKVIDASYTTVVPWMGSKHLKSGYGIPNHIKVVRDEVDVNKYHLYLNNEPVNYFIDGEEPYCEGSGRSGYVVVISPTDLNDAGAVEVLFSEGDAP